MSLPLKQDIKKMNKNLIIT